MTEEHPIDVVNDVHSSGEEDETFELTIYHHNTPQKLQLPLDATIIGLSEEVSDTLSVPVENQKFMIQKLGLLKAPFKDPSLRVESFKSNKVTLMGATSAELQSLNDAHDIAARKATRAKKKRTVHAYKTRDWKKESEESQYTFLTLRPLPYLPRPERSLEFLERLKHDPGIKAAMVKHKWTVPLLTEMNPIEHTTSDVSGTSRTLGLNRNRGEVIELRLRTDAYDGYRDYKTIRNTLCHEMAHNVFGPHDRNFWDLCKEIEKEVAAADWKHGGHKIADENVYDGPIHKGGFGDDDEEYADDHGGWTGGEFVLGAAIGTERPAGDGPSQGQGGMSRREMLAKAAEQRIKRLQNHGQGSGGGSSS